MLIITQYVQRASIEKACVHYLSLKYPIVFWFVSVNEEYFNENLQTLLKENDKKNDIL